MFQESNSEERQSDLKSQKYYIFPSKKEDPSLRKLVLPIQVLINNLSIKVWNKNKLNFIDFFFFRSKSDYKKKKKMEFLKYNTIILKSYIFKKNLFKFSTYL